MCEACGLSTPGRWGKGWLEDFRRGLFRDGGEIDGLEVHDGGAWFGAGLDGDGPEAGGGEVDGADGAGDEVLEVAGVFDGEFEGGDGRGGFVGVDLSEGDFDEGTAGALAAALDDFDVEFSGGVDRERPRGGVCGFGPEAERVFVLRGFVAEVFAGDGGAD